VSSIVQDIHRWESVRVLLARSKDEFRVAELHEPSIQEAVRRRIHDVVGSASGVVVSVNDRGDFVIDFPGAIDGVRKTYVDDVLRNVFPDDVGAYWEGTNTRVTISSVQVYVSFEPEEKSP
jgi:hypothetical protein